MARILDRALDFEERHKTAISIVLGAWMMLGWITWTGWIPFPDIPFLTDEVLLWSSIGVNALWWAGMRPALESRRKQRELADPAKDAGD